MYTVSDLLASNPPQYVLNAIANTRPEPGQDAEIRKFGYDNMVGYVIDNPQKFDPTARDPRIPGQPAYYYAEVADESRLLTRRIIANALLVLGVDGFYYLVNPESIETIKRITNFDTATYVGVEAGTGRKIYNLNNTILQEDVQGNNRIYAVRFPGLVYDDNGNLLNPPTPTPTSPRNGVPEPTPTPTSVVPPVVGNPTTPPSVPIGTPPSSGPTDPNNTTFNSPALTGYISAEIRKEITALYGADYYSTLPELERNLEVVSRALATAVKKYLIVNVLAS